MFIYTSVSSVWFWPEAYLVILVGEEPRFNFSYIFLELQVKLFEIFKGKEPNISMIHNLMIL